MNNATLESTLFSDHPDTMWLFDQTSLMLLDVNQCALDELGYSRQQLLAKSMLDLLRNEDHAALRQALQNMAPRLSPVGRWWLRCESGALLPGEIRWQAVPGPAGPALLVAMRDQRQ